MLDVRNEQTVENRVFYYKSRCELMHDVWNTTE